MRKHALSAAARRDVARVARQGASGAIIFFPRETEASENGRNGKIRYGRGANTISKARYRVSFLNFMRCG